MRIGYTTSVIGHAVILAFALVSLPGAEPYEVEQIDALPVDLVDITDVTALSEGIETAPERKEASQAKVKTPTPRPESTRAGNAPEDQDTPVTEKATKTAAAPSSEPPPPAPSPPPAPKAEPTPEPPAPEAPPEEPEPAPPEPAPPEPAEAAPPPKAEVAELPSKPELQADAAPAPVPPSAKPRSKPAPPKPVETASADTTASTNRRTTEPTTPVEKPADSKTKPQQKDFDLNEMSALLNKVDPSGGGGRTSENEASLGSRSATGAVAKMSQSEIDALRAAIEACWTPPIGAEGVEGLMVPIRVEFNLDGSLAAEPVAQQIPPGPVGQVMAEAALNAVRRCAPYSFLPPEKFEVWQTVNINFRPPALF